MNATQMQIIGENSSRCELLAACDYDTAVRLFRNPGIKRRIRLFMCGLATIDLRRNDRVGDVAMLVTKVRIEISNILAKTGASDSENFGLRGKSGEKVGDMVRRTSHQAKCLFCPCFGRQPLGSQ